MKKKNFRTLVTIMAVAVTALALAGCAKKDEVKYITDLETGKYIKDIDYKSLKVYVDKPSVDESYVAYLTQKQFSTTAASVDAEKLIMNRAVENGDLINLDFSGTKDGVAFEGGTSSNYVLEIGSHSFIDGFEDGLVGVMPGQTVDLNLTFPENYHAEDLAGADVVFTCTVNGIIPEEEIYNKWNETYGSASPVTSYEELEDFLRNYLMQSEQAEYESNLNNEVVKKLVESVQVKKEFPASLIIAYQDNARTELETSATYYGYSRDEYAQAMYGMSADEYIQDSSYDLLKLDAAVCYIAEKEGLNISDETLEERLKEIVFAYGYEDYEDAKQQLGIDLKQYRVYFLEEDVITYLINETGIAD